MNLKKMTPCSGGNNVFENKTDANLESKKLQRWIDFPLLFLNSNMMLWWKELSNTSVKTFPYTFIWVEIY